ncbi:MAG: beta-lactamase family protein [Chloroflexota bacterium]|nr:beta-lactamase family protein [Chloroflexota bacterium]
MTTALSPRSIDRAADAAAIARIVAAEQARHPIPGVVVGVAFGDDEIVAPFGITNVDHPLPVDAGTLFQVGSITKTFLGTLVMRLVEEGRLDLDTPVRRWVPELRLRDEDAARGVTLRHLLTHRAGWFGDHFEDTGSNDDALARYVELMATFEQQVPVGTIWAYNNAAFALTGRIVEKATDRPVEAAMRELLLVPLGLDHTFFFADQVITYRVASGHNVFDGTARVARPWALARASNCLGGIVSTVPQLLRYARFHMGDGAAAGGGRYLSPAAMALMRSHLAAGPLGQWRGIAWAIQDAHGVDVIFHGGATIGQQALLHIAPSRRFALAMLTNTSQAAQIQSAMAAWAWERYLGAEHDEPAARAHTEAEAARVAGTYRQPANELRITVAGDGLVLHQRPLESSFRKRMEEPPPIPKPVPLAFCAADRLLLLEGPLAGSQVEVLGPEWVRFGSRIYRRVSEAGTASAPGGVDAR